MRERWMSLNGVWEYAIRPLADGLSFPEKPDGTIVVPFPLESSLSGAQRSITKDDRLFYRRQVTLPPTPAGHRLLLHFEAVDWGTKVFINDAGIGDHTGGYDPFSFDITDRVKPGENTFMVEVWDPCDEASEYEPPRGKQVRKPSGIWYTSVTGIWQSVWLEWVPERAIDEVTFVPDVARGKLSVTPRVRRPIGPDAKVEVTLRWPDAPEGAPAVTKLVAPNATTDIDIPNPILWSPESPKLYAVNLRYGVDRVNSYVAFRTVEVKPDAKGTPRVMLNGAPYFMLGTLDQGWWPDGLYTAPTHEAMVYDIEVTKALGFNTIRKHVKIEPATWYAACDRLGILVWQDMPSSGPYIGGADPDANRGDRSKRVYETELTAMVERLSFHPSIVMWVPFNEGWGQHDSQRIVDLIKAKDPTRLVNHASGWTDRGIGDIFDIHDYSASLAGHCPKGDGKRAVVIGEFGGLGLPVPGHRWKEEGWGYQTFGNYQDLTDAYVGLVEEIAELKADGLCGVIYTQTTDVEVEVNGLMSYDRDILKMNSAEVSRANRATITSTAASRVFEPVVPSAKEIEAVDARPTWRYTVEEPAANWADTTFDDAAWKEGKPGFGTAQTPGAIVGTEWTTNAIWLRRTIEIPEGAGMTHLSIHHDEDAELFLDGKPFAQFKGYTGSYSRKKLTPAMLAALTPGKHLLAVRVKQTSGGQYLDCGILREKPTPTAP
jgi:Glycosyl hydrolases family 2, TIM barrel domain/Glycosyl hydrolases family 2, sugar binding domain/Glycosyl hydrolases family 2